MPDKLTTDKEKLDKESLIIAAAEATDFANPALLPSLTLAYLGDAVYEVYVRSRLIADGLRRVNELHDAAVPLVSAAGQSELFSRIEPLLTEEESDVYRRARNAKSPHRRRGAEPVDYHRATGLEALVGFLFLAGRQGKLSEMVEVLFAAGDSEADTGAETGNE